MVKSRKFNSTTKSSAVRVAEAKLRVAQRNLRKALREDASKGFVACERDWDDDVDCALLPESSIYAGKYIVYSISSQGMWKAAAAILDNLDTSKLIDCNPFYDYDEDEETTGVHFGQDGLADFLADLYTPEDDDYDDYEFY